MVHNTFSIDKLCVTDRSKSILLWWFFLFYVLVFKKCLCCWRLMYVFIILVKLTEWPPVGKIAAHSAYDMFHGISTRLLVCFFSPRFLEWESFSDCAFS